VQHTPGMSQVPEGLASLTFTAEMLSVAENGTQAGKPGVGSRQILEVPLLVPRLGRPTLILAYNVRSLSHGSEHRVVGRQRGGELA